MAGLSLLWPRPLRIHQATRQPWEEEEKEEEEEEEE
jgi:hypothetical protein